MLHTYRVFKPNRLLCCCIASSNWSFIVPDTTDTYQAHPLPPSERELPSRFGGRAAERLRQWDIYSYFYRLESKLAHSAQLGGSTYGLLVGLAMRRFLPRQAIASKMTRTSVFWTSECHALRSTLFLMPLGAFAPSGDVCLPKKGLVSRLRQIPSLKPSIGCTWGGSARLSSFCLCTAR